MPFSEPTKNQLHALWEAGIALDSAWVEFAVFFDRFTHRALRTNPDNDPELLAPEPRYQVLSKGWLPKTWEARQKKLAITTKSERLSLLGEIYAEYLWAIGFRTLPSGSDELVRVPRQHFFVDEAGERNNRPDIHWGKGELCVSATTYFDIRVVRSPITRDARLASASAKERGDCSTSKSRRRKAKRLTERTTTLPKRKRKKVGGRHNTSREIRGTTRQLLSVKPELRNLPIKLLVGHVRAAILGDEKRDVEEKDYKSSSMAKAIGNELSAQRKRIKRNKPNKA